MSDHCRISSQVVPFILSQMSILWIVVLCPYFSLHFWEMARVDGVIHLEVSNPTITSGGWCSWRWHGYTNCIGTRGVHGWGYSSGCPSWCCFLAIRLGTVVEDNMTMPQFIVRAPKCANTKFSDCDGGRPFNFWIWSANSVLGSIWGSTWVVSSWIEDGDIVYNHYHCLKGHMLTLLPDGRANVVMLST